MTDDVTPQRGSSEATGSVDYTPGRFVLADTDAEGARDPIGLTQQVKFMREGLKRAGHDPALILVVVADAERKAAVERIHGVLEQKGDGDA